MGIEILTRTRDLNMKHSRQLAVVVAIALASSAQCVMAIANSVILNLDGYTYFPGGEFQALTTEPGNYLTDYSPKAIVGGGFETFCIETTVDFNPGQSYTYDFSQVDSFDRPLTKGAAFLYEEFARGNLPGYDYTDQSTRSLDAGEMESALWWLQYGQTYPNFPDPLTDPYYLFTIGSLGLANAESPNNNKYPVDVFQMWDGDVAAQNQLLLVPDNAPTVLLFGLGLGALAFLAPKLRPARVRLKADAKPRR
jgi:hypothetical protein